MRARVALPKTLTHNKLIWFIRPESNVWCPESDSNQMGVDLSQQLLTPSGDEPSRDPAGSTRVCRAGGFA
jgi:hypothetical protein